MPLRTVTRRFIGLPKHVYGDGQDLKTHSRNSKDVGDFPTWAKRIAAHDFDMTMDNLWNWGDPIIGVHRTYLSTNIRPIAWTNTQSYRNPEVDRLLQAAGEEQVPAKRKAYYAEFQKIVTDDLPVYFINVIPFHTAALKQVGNVPKSIWGPLSPFDDVFLKRQ